MVFTLLKSLELLIRLIEFLILWRVIMSWLVLLGSTNSFVKIVYDLTEIFMSPAKKFLDVIGLSNTVFDFSAMLVILVLEIIKIVIFYIISVIFR